MSTIKELICRLESAEEGSRELSYEVWKATEDAVYFDTLPGPECTAYTTSLDAITGLIERKLPGCRWSIKVDDGQEGFWAHLRNAQPHLTEARYVANADAKTPALAACIALLKALGSLDHKEGVGS